MSESDIIQIAIAVVTFLGIIISSIIAIVSIKQNNKISLQPRFDVIEVFLEKDTKKLLQINHITNAFMA